MRGRRPAGPEYVAQTQGSVLAQERARLILETLAQRCTVQQACARLRIGPSRFHQLRAAFLQGGVERLEPKPAGRPRRVVSAATQRISALEQQVVEQALALEVAQVREEVALILPQVQGADAAGPVREPADHQKKTRQPEQKRRRQDRREN